MTTEHKDTHVFPQISIANWQARSMTGQGNVLFSGWSISTSFTPLRSIGDASSTNDVRRAFLTMLMDLMSPPA